MTQYNLGQYIHIGSTYIGSTHIGSASIVPDINLFRSASRFRVTGHFEISALNDHR